MMKANVTYYKNTIIGIKGERLSEILDKACTQLNLNSIGRSKLIYKITEK